MPSGIGGFEGSQVGHPWGTSETDVPMGSRVAAPVVSGGEASEAVI